MASKPAEIPSDSGATPAQGQAVTPEQRKTLEQRAADGEKLNVGELALVTGNLRKVNLPTITTINTVTGNTDVDHASAAFSPAHKAAATLHGWVEHSHHTARPIEITRDDYLAALKAANETTKGFIVPVPHGPAFSPHAPPVTLVTDKLDRKPFNPTEKV